MTANPQSTVISTVNTFRSSYMREHGLTEQDVIDNSITFHSGGASQFNEPKPVGTPLPPRLVSLLTDGREYAIFPYFNQRREPIMCTPTLAGVKIQAVHLRVNTASGDSHRKAPQLPGVEPLLYLPNWPGDISEFWSNPEKTFNLTEGQAKSIFLTKVLGEYAAAAAGVWCIWNKSKSRFYHPLDEMVIRGRKLRVFFDQDPQSTFENPYKKDVSNAANCVAAAWLRKGGKSVEFIYIRRTSLGEKCAGRKLGVDDYFLKGGSLQELLTTAVLAEESSAIIELLKGYAITTNGKVYDSINRQEMDMTGLRNLYANRLSLDDGNPADAWRGHEGRILLKENGFLNDPGKPLGLSQDGYMNLWEPFAVSPAETPNPEHIKEFKTFIYGLVAGTKDIDVAHPFADWLIGWLAHLVQCPREIAIHIVFMLSSDRFQGCGKTLLAEIIVKIIGEMHGFVLEGNEFVDPGNKFKFEQENKEFLCLDELELRSPGTTSFLKFLATSKNTSVNQKHEKKRHVSNAIRVYIPSNSTAPVPLHDGGRREFVARFAPPDGRWAEWQKWVKDYASRVLGDESLPALASIHGWLRQQDYEALGYDPHGPALDTPAKEAMVAASRSKRSTTAVSIVERLPPLFAWCPALGVELTKGNDQYHEQDVLRYAQISGAKNVSLSAEFVINLCSVVGVSINVTGSWGPKVTRRTYNIKVAHQSELFQTEMVGEGANRRRVPSVPNAEILEALMATARALYSEQLLTPDPDTGSDGDAD